MNLFWSTRALTAAKEDHLTEFFAAALNLSERFRSSYTNLVLAGLFESEPIKIQTVTTQVNFPNTTCCPDMLLTLSDGRKILCEHKLDAFETTGPEQDPRGSIYFTSQQVPRNVQAGYSR
jgi:hypothetical protein